MITIFFFCVLSSYIACKPAKPSRTSQTITYQPNHHEPIKPTRTKTLFHRTTMSDCLHTEYLPSVAIGLVLAFMGVGDGGINMVLHVGHSASRSVHTSHPGISFSLKNSAVPSTVDFGNGEVDLYDVFPSRVAKVLSHFQTDVLFHQLAHRMFWDLLAKGKKIGSTLEVERSIGVSTERPCVPNIDPRQLLDEAARVRPPTVRQGASSSSTKKCPPGPPEGVPKSRLDSTRRSGKAKRKESRKTCPSLLTTS